MFFLKQTSSWNNEIPVFSSLEGRGPFFSLLKPSPSCCWQWHCQSVLLSRRCADGPPRSPAWETADMSGTSWLINSSCKIGERPERRLIYATICLPRQKGYFVVRVRRRMEAQALRFSGDAAFIRRGRSSDALVMGYRGDGGKLTAFWEAEVDTKMHDCHYGAVTQEPDLEEAQTRMMQGSCWVLA